MLTQENNDLLLEIHRAATMGQQAIEMVLPKTENPKLKEKIESQENAYGRIAMQAARMLSENDITPEKQPLMQKMGQWFGIRKETMQDHSSSRIAEMMIQGSGMGITDITKKLNALSEADAGARELAEEYLDCENKHIESMKKYL